MQNKMTNVQISDTEKGSDLLQSKPHLPLQCLSFIKFYHYCLIKPQHYAGGFCCIMKKQTVPRFSVALAMKNKTPFDMLLYDIIATAGNDKYDIKSFCFRKK